MLVLPPVFWAGNAVVGRFAVADAPPLELSFWRWVIAFIVLLPAGLPRVLAQRQVLRAHWRALAILALFSVAAYNTLLYLALTTTTAINATFVGACMPLLIVLFSWFMLGERVNGRHMLGIAAGLVGVALVIGRGDPMLVFRLQLNPGDVLVLTAVVSWAIYSVLLRKFQVPMEPVGLLTVLVGLGVLYLVPVYAWAVHDGAGMPLTWPMLLVVGYISLFPSLLAYLFWNKGVEAVGANQAGLFAYLVPVLTALLAVPVLGEALTWYHGVGLVLIFAGIWVATSAQPPPYISNDS